MFIFPYVQNMQGQKNGCQSFGTVLLTDWTAAKEIVNRWKIKEAKTRLQDQTRRLSVAKIEKIKIVCDCFSLQYFC